MTAKPEQLYELIGEIRRGFHSLKNLTDRLHEDSNLTASMRAVMESLADTGARTVPEIARSKGVTRQHIQVNVDALLAAGLAEAHVNPAHRRSSLIALTTEGEKLFAEVRRREAKVLTKLAASQQRQSLATAIQVLGALRAEIEQLSTGDQQ